MIAQQFDYFVSLWFFGLISIDELKIISFDVFFYLIFGNFMTTFVIRFD